MLNRNVSTALLEATAVDKKELASNFIDVATGCECSLDGATMKSELINRFPLTMWLLNTRMANDVRGRFNLSFVNRDDNGKWRMKVPGNVWTLPQNSAATECCWHPFDFAKCCGEVPMNLLCLKDCDSVFDELVMRDIHVTSKEALRGISASGESFETVNKRINKLSFAFLTAYTSILGLPDTYTNILKPFHGLLAVMENPAILPIYATDVLTAFKQLGCRLDALGDTDRKVIAAHPLTIGGIRNALTKDRFGEWPRDWTVNDANGTIRYKGIPFLADKTMPVDLQNNKGEAWMLDSDHVGLFLSADLFIPDSYIKESGVDTSVDNCGAECDYYYNYGTAFNDDSNRLAKIVDIPLDSACAGAALAGLEGIVSPQTLIPNGEVA